MRMENLNAYLKEILTCTTCGKCRVVCPVFENIGWESAVTRGKILLSYGLLTEEISPEESVVERIYQCTTCANCEITCPSRVKIVDIIEACRKDLYAVEKYLETHKKIVENILEFGNPFADKRSKSDIFDKNKKKAKIGYFVGCVSAYKETNIGFATIKVLDNLGIYYTLIDEICCGSVLRRIGASGNNDENFKKLISENVKRIESLGVEIVVCSCAGCYRVLKKEYPLFCNLNFEVLHISEFLEKQQLNLRNYNKIVTYHDPCHLGRHCGIYTPPRNIIKKIPSVTFKELKYSKELAKCCGGGGGLKSGFPDLAKDIADRRVEEAKFADILLTACPFCVLNLKENIYKVAVKDIMELIADLIV